jgi:hypothetical protein
MKLTKILESVLITEIGDASAEGFSLSKPNVKGAINKADNISFAAGKYAILDNNIEPKY